MGCTNDVLPALDRWCSGRRDCSFLVPNDELEKANQNCLKILKMYLQVDYTCYKGTFVVIGAIIGTLVRAFHNLIVNCYAADIKGCGTSNSPWIIVASPGQTITLTLIDFSANSKSPSSCPIVFGYVREVALGINYTICGGRHREGTLYTSTTNNVELYVMPRNKRNKLQFIIEYSTVVMTAVTAGALVLVVVAIVIGVVYIKKYRIRQETKYLTKTYSTLEKNAKFDYERTTLNQMTDNPPIWDGTLIADPRDSSNIRCACATLQMRDSVGMSPERQSLYSSIKSNQ
ncbi:hypothetical protein LSH36_839g03051 [Paralvinella palmiformis]|uniref:SUEL-type lectin domain-containing protein n=1 Tax=Paralvinella palmiformis TaxID=53620 RepID=A0AAD9MTE2_9ANNE|nr:hypothetical protein LSH36_839g03051 [Paralvinella palmiformis]